MELWEVVSCWAVVSVRIPQHIQSQCDWLWHQPVCKGTCRVLARLSWIKLTPFAPCTSATICSYSVVDANRLKHYSRQESLSSSNFYVSRIKVGSKYLWIFASRGGTRLEIWKPSIRRWNSVATIWKPSIRRRGSGSTIWKLTSARG